MIRIDEIYNNVFWPWIEQSIPGTRMFFCDPPGHTRPENIFKLFDNTRDEIDYVFFHDQEPVDIDLYDELFFKIWIMNLNLSANEVTTILTQNKNIHKYHTNFIRQCLLKKIPPSFDEFFNSYKDQILQEFNGIIPKQFTKFGKIVVSERGEKIQEIKEQFGWEPHYYFYHGWACQDWYRGYDRTFLIPRAKDREPTRTFISPNRIIGGHRDHRVLFLYHVFKNKLEHNYISAPRICSQEQVDISTVASKYLNTYSDIVQYVESAELPRLFLSLIHI